MRSSWSIRFNSNITDEELREFFGSTQIEKIERGSWMSDVTVFSEEPSETLGRRLEDWYKNKRAEENERLQRYWAEKYKKDVEEFYKDYLGFPVVKHTRDGKRLEGYMLMGDDGKWLPPVYPDLS